METDNLKSKIFFLLVTLLALRFALVYLNGDYIMTESVAESGLSGNYDQRHIEKWQSINTLINWPNYFAKPVRMLFSIGVVTLLCYSQIAVGEKTFSLTRLTHIILSGYIILLFGEIAKFIWFGFLVPEGYTLWDIRNFHYFSILYFMDIYSLQEWELEVYSMLGIPLLCFILITADRISKTGEKEFGRYVLVLVVSILFLGIVKVAYEVLL